jgi:hypothetical protein
VQREQRPEIKRRGPRDEIPLTIARAIAAEYVRCLGIAPTHGGRAYGEAQRRKGVPMTDFDRVCEEVDDLLQTLGKPITISEGTRRTAAREAAANMETITEK